MAINLEVEMKGHEELTAKLSDPAVIIVPVEELLKEAANIGAGAAVNYLSGKGYRGAAAQTIRTAQPEPLLAKVYSLMSDARVRSMHEGRPAGTSLPIRMVASWLLGPGLLRDITGKERSKVMYAWNEIRRRGAKATTFFNVAEAAINHSLPGLISKAKEKIIVRLSE